MTLVADSYMSARAVIAKHLLDAVGEAEARRLLRLADMWPHPEALANAMNAAEDVLRQLDSAAVRAGLPSTVDCDRMPA